ncbi:peptidase inhibitor family I36 protein [Saccharopolyspora sp. TS4A08]|uniref:Peptidase inhibitor family I36 protein n=1 Tax=Saccharopolyspora ipomoeae TaxID=3042027 RepID=A0ABT6PUC5_9PSEU|nr:peptidase inhibitor family I36 protein [Saccharopolyspora sp. TS4A08]MDI2031599.1 peptidase inhibitor family I36 protein [Saccharopolyspora sp. TS4A08]
MPSHALAHRFRPSFALALALAVALSLAALLTGPTADATESRCAAGSFCVWPEPGFGGETRELTLRATGIEQCVALETGWEAKSFANSTGHPVTVYQDPHCDEEADFDTHPTGSQTPQAEYVARAIKVWTH